MSLTICVSIELFIASNLIEIYILFSGGCGYCDGADAGRQPDRLRGCEAPHVRAVHRLRLQEDADGALLHAQRIQIAQRHQIRQYPHQL